MGSTNQTTLRIHYDAGWNNFLSIRGEEPLLSWTKGARAEWEEGNIWTFQFQQDQDSVEFKVLLNDKEWSIGANMNVTRGKIHDIFPFFQRRKGHLELLHHFDTPIVIYLPPSYGENEYKHYPVAYLHDGQNLFDPATAFGGNTWGLHETIDRLVSAGEMDEIIAVGIFNRGKARIHDFTPSYDPYFMGVGVGGGAEDYLNLLVHEIKPFIDSRFRTLTAPEKTALIGSSLGGLVSLYMARKRPDVFSMVGALSSTFWWNRRNLIKRILATRRYIPLRIYLDAGARDNGQETLEMYHALQWCGHTPAQDLYCHIAPKHAHNEIFWGMRVHLPLKFLFPFDGRHQPLDWPEEDFVANGMPFPDGVGLTISSWAD